MKRIPFYTLIICATMLLFISIPTAAAANSQLGVYLQELDDDLREHFNYSGNGVLITGIIPGTVAAKAGLSEEDIIAEINRERMNSIGDVRRIIQNTEPGKEIDLSVIRNGKTMKFHIRLMEKNPSYVHSPQKWIYYPENDRPWVGIRMQDLNPQLAEYFDTKTGLLITEVIKDSPAEAAKLNAGDVITGWNNHDISHTDDFYKRLDESEPGDEIQLSVIRRGRQKKTTITLAEPVSNDNRLFRFYIDKDDPEAYILRFRKPRIHPFPSFGQSGSEDSYGKSSEDSRMDALEKQMGILQEKMDKLIHQMSK